MQGPLNIPMTPHRAAEFKRQIEGNKGSLRALVVGPLRVPYIGQETTRSAIGPSMSFPFDTETSHDTVHMEATHILIYVFETGEILSRISL